MFFSNFHELKVRLNSHGNLTNRFQPLHVLLAKPVGFDCTKAAEPDRLELRPN